MAECPPLFYFVFNTNICTLPKLRLMSLNSTPFVDVCFNNFVVIRVVWRILQVWGTCGVPAGPEWPPGQQKGAKRGQNSKKWLHIWVPFGCLWATIFVSVLMHIFDTSLEELLADFGAQTEPKWSSPGRPDMRLDHAGLCFVKVGRFCKKSSPRHLREVVLTILQRF